MKIFILNKTDYVEFDIELVTTDEDLFFQRLQYLFARNLHTQYEIEIWENNELYFSVEGSKCYKLENLFRVKF